MKKLPWNDVVLTPSMYLWETEVPTLTLKEWEVLRTTGSGEFVLEGDSFS